MEINEVPPLDLKVSSWQYPHPFMNPHGPADLVVGDGDALGLEELLERQHRSEDARVHHGSWNSCHVTYRIVHQHIGIKRSLLTKSYQIPVNS